MINHVEDEFISRLNQKIARTVYRPSKLILWTCSEVEYILHQFKKEKEGKYIASTYNVFLEIGSNSLNFIASSDTMILNKLIRVLVAKDMHKKYYIYFKLIIQIYNEIFNTKIDYKKLYKQLFISKKLIDNRYGIIDISIDNTKISGTHLKNWLKPLLFDMSFLENNAVI